MCPSVANATPGCNGFVCGIGKCSAGFADCDNNASTGCERSITTLTSCGGCGLGCSTANATPTCSTAVCQVSSCNTGFGDCNKSAADGCEVNLNTDAANCGTCGNGCTGMNICVSGKCVSPTPASCRAQKATNPSSADGIYTISPDGTSGNTFKVYCDMTTAGGGWTLVMKLGSNSYCYGSTNWTAKAPVAEASMTDTTTGFFDAESRGFYLLGDTTSLRFDTKHGSVTVGFASPSSPQTLITTNTIPFSAYPDYTNWRAAFQQDRSQAPIFMRAGVAVTVGNTCRTNPNNTPSGCGQLCMFCYQAADTSCCGCAATNNDVNSGIGNNPAYCGGGVGSNCSSGGTWSDPNQQTLLWAK